MYPDYLLLHILSRLPMLTAVPWIVHFRSVNLHPYKSTESLLMSNATTVTMEKLILPHPAAIPLILSHGVQLKQPKISRILLPAPTLSELLMIKDVTRTVHLSSANQMHSLSTGLSLMSNAMAAMTEQLTSLHREV